MTRRRSTVEVGDLFKKTDATRWIWQVAEVFQPVGHQPHARLFRRNLAHDVRVFALSALRDGRLFIPVDARERQEAPVEPPEFALTRRLRKIPEARHARFEPRVAACATPPADRLPRTRSSTEDVSIFEG